MKLSAVRTNEERLFQTLGVQHENRRAAVFVDENCVDSRSDVDDLRTRDCLEFCSLMQRHSRHSETVHQAMEMCVYGELVSL